VPRSTALRGVFDAARTADGFPPAARLGATSESPIYRVPMCGRLGSGTATKNRRRWRYGNKRRPACLNFRPSCERFKVPAHTAYKTASRFREQGTVNPNRFRLRIFRPRLARASR